jgi:hypothetical protein
MATKKTSTKRRANKSKKSSASKKARAGAGRGKVGEFVQEQLLKTSKPYDEIMDATRKKFPEAKTSRSAVRWYASKLRGAGENIPERDRRSEMRA